MPNYLAMEKFINKQVKFWESQKARIILHDDSEQAKPFITIEREYGCLGYDLGKKIVELLNTKYPGDLTWAAYDKQVLDKVMEDMGLSASLAKSLTDDARQQLTNVLNTSFSKFPPQVSVYKKLAETIRMLAANGNVVIIGRAGNVITREMKGGYNIRIIAPMDYKINNIMKIKGVDKKEAEKLIIDNTARRVNYIREFVDFDIMDPHNYHLILNAAKFNIEEMAEVVIQGLKIKGHLPS
ncbi:MAG TPA: cytidylate kinase-like family protein [Spirochaetota bacterium]|nr:cytidylate kinase-like family protein [Spirochaetota bacterium]HPI89520.1 cytidylate kinase-like family protein [Spirochaetota bacterium]HPR47108.1 cytidylate kinase-like family protein [Spirochaetota bacterium]